MQRSLLYSCQGWKHVYSRLVNFNDWKHFNKVGYELFCVDPQEDKQLTGFGETTICFFCNFKGAQTTMAANKNEIPSATFRPSSCLD
eukprot:15138744-Heterocapsa_arctica.AAC.1